MKGIREEILKFDPCALLSRLGRDNFQKSAGIAPTARVLNFLDISDFSSVLLATVHLLICFLSHLDDSF